MRKRPWRFIDSEGMMDSCLTAEPHDMMQPRLPFPAHRLFWGGGSIAVVQHVLYKCQQGN
eukprot:4219258-Pyramimonas_sp.AAC.1